MLFRFQAKRKRRERQVSTEIVGSVRGINGKLYVDFIYLGERVREKVGLDDNKENIKLVRQQLDKIIMAVGAGSFRFAEIFPQSKKRDYFKSKESEVYGHKKTPVEVNVNDYVWQWYNRLKSLVAFPNVPYMVINHILIFT